MNLQLKDFIEPGIGSILKHKIEAQITRLYYFLAYKVYWWINENLVKEIEVLN